MRNRDKIIYIFGVSFFILICITFWDKRKLADSITDFMEKEKERIERIK